MYTVGRYLARHTDLEDVSANVLIVDNPQEVAARPSQAEDILDAEQFGDGSDQLVGQPEK